MTPTQERFIEKKPHVSCILWKHVQEAGPAPEMRFSLAHQEDAYITTTSGVPTGSHGAPALPWFPPTWHHVSFQVRALT